MPTITELDGLDQLIRTQLKSYVTAIDQEGYYPAHFLKQLGQRGFYLHPDRSDHPLLTQQIRLLEHVAEVCLSTAFNLWCHLACITYLRRGHSAFLRERLLPTLEKGNILGGTGLSNPMKYYAGLEKLRLTAQRSKTGYQLNGTLPFVSNLSEAHWFALIANAGERRIAAVLPVQTEGLVLREQTQFMALNGTGTYSCQFGQVEIPKEWVLAEEADQFVETIRPTFLLTQTALGLGLIRANLAGMAALARKQNGINQYIEDQPETLRCEWETLREAVYQLAEWVEKNDHQSAQGLPAILRVRRQAAQLALRTAQAELLHSGAAGYLKHSPANRRLREAYFLAILTPAIKQLNKMLAHNA